MKMIMLCYNEAMDLEVMEALEQCTINNYTKIPAAFGKGTTSGTHLGNDIWPGLNNILYIACDEIAMEKLLPYIKKLKNDLGHEGIKAFTWNLEEVL